MVCIVDQFYWITRSNLIDESSNNPKEMWKTINKVLNKSLCSTTPRSVMYDCQHIENQKGIAETFNNHFITIGPKLAEKIETKESDNPLKYFTNENASTAPNFEFQPITSDLIKNEIKKLKCNKSSGYDKTSVQFVKDAAEILCNPLAAIFNSSFKMGIFPDILEIARITSIFNLVLKATWAIIGLYPFYLFSRGYWKNLGTIKSRIT